MESVPDTDWDVVISGTGLHQSLLALALSRTGKNVLHVDENEYYGGPEAAFSLQEVDEWAAKHASSNNDALFSGAEVTRDGDGLAFPRAYSLALAPQVVHARSKLLEQLVSSKAFRQVEFLAVGSIYIYQVPLSPTGEATGVGSLARIPSTREDVFTNTAIATRAKRRLMKFLKFVLDFDAESQAEVWRPHATEPLKAFLASEFSLDESLQSYISTLTLSHRAGIPVEAGLTSIHRQLTSMGVLGPGFAAVYPKWGGISEVAQVGCRAGAVGGAVYMLGTGVASWKKPAVSGEQERLEVGLTNSTTVRTKILLQGSQECSKSSLRITRLVAVVKSDLGHLFGPAVEGAPTPAVAVVAFPPGSVTAQSVSNKNPIHTMVHSSDTGECPTGQCVLYLSTTDGPRSLLRAAMSDLLATIPDKPQCIFQLAYEQSYQEEQALQVDGQVATFLAASVSLAFDDASLEPVREAWKLVSNTSEDSEYMVFGDREGQVDDDEV